jgi:hypothetical protein
LTPRESGFEPRREIALKAKLRLARDELSRVEAAPTHPMPSKSPFRDFLDMAFSFCHIFLWHSQTSYIRLEFLRASFQFQLISEYWITGVLE